MKFINLLIILLIITTSGCRQKSSPAILELPTINKDTVITDTSGKKWTIKLNAKDVTISESLNGLVIYSYTTNKDNYTYDRYGNISKIIFKPQYYNDSLKVSIKYDTVKLGQNFHASVWSSLPIYEVELKEPEARVLRSADDIGEGIDIPCNTKGLFKFKGVIRSDKMEIPFEYLYIVQ